MQQKENFEAYIVIITYNGMKWLPLCLQSVSEYRFIIVDNGSNDGTIEFIKTNYPEIVLFENGENLGFGRANNQGIEYAFNKGADYVFLLNQDAYLKPGCIEQLIRLHQKNQDFGILSPLHLNGDGSRLDKMFSIYMGYNGNPDFYSDYLLNKQLKEIYQVPFINAAGWLISRECVEKVGGFDPIFYHYGEDENYCQRLRFHGFQIGVVPTSFIYHDREERLQKKRKKGLEEHFKRMEKELKIEFGNINIMYAGKLLEILERRKKSLLKSFIKMNLKDYNYYKRETKLLKKISVEIENSRTINQRRGSSYLNLNRK